MKKVSITYCNRSLRFCRWSRKAYSAFCSVGRHVTIGALRKAVAECSLMKHNPLQTVTSFIEKVAVELVDIDDDIDVLDALMANIVSCRIVNTTECAPIYVYFKN